MVLSSLRHEGQSRCEETRYDIVIHNGSANHFKESHFQTEREITAAKDYDNKKNNNGKTQSPSGKTAELSYQASAMPEIVPIHFAGGYECDLVAETSLQQENLRWAEVDPQIVPIRSTDGYHDEKDVPIRLSDGC